MKPRYKIGSDFIHTVDHISRLYLSSQLPSLLSTFCPQSGFPHSLRMGTADPSIHIQTWQHLHPKVFLRNKLSQKPSVHFSLSTTGLHAHLSISHQQETQDPLDWLGRLKIQSPVLGLPPSRAFLHQERGVATLHPVGQIRPTPFLFGPWIYKMVSIDEPLQSIWW